MGNLSLYSLVLKLYKYLQQCSFELWELIQVPDYNRPLEQYILHQLQSQLINRLCLLGGHHLRTNNDGLGELLKEPQGLFEK
jgi:hypothetical protein